MSRSVESKGPSYKSHCPTLSFSSASCPEASQHTPRPPSELITSWTFHSFLDNHRQLSKVPAYTLFKFKWRSPNWEKSQYTAQHMTTSTKEKWERPESFRDTAPGTSGLGTGKGWIRIRCRLTEVGRGCHLPQSRQVEAHRSPSSKSSGDPVHWEAQFPFHMIFPNPHLTLWPWVL